MASTIRCDIVSAEEEIFHGEVSMVVATGEMGELGIAPRHAPLITRLKPGQVRLTLANGEEQLFYVSGGILEVQPQVVTVLTDTAIRGGDLDEALLRLREILGFAAAGEDALGLFLRLQHRRLVETQAQLQALARLKQSLKH